MPELQQEALASRGKAIFVGFDHASTLLASHVNQEIHHFASSLHSQSERFKIWAVDLGLLVPGHGSLDYRVREAENVQQTIRAYLNDLSEYLRNLGELGSSQSLNDYQVRISTESPNFAIDDADTSDDEDMDQAAYISILLQNVEDVIDRLFKLSTKIRNPSTRLISTRAKLYRYIDEDSGCDLLEAFKHYDYCHVLSIFRGYYQKASSEVYEASLGNFVNGEDEVEEKWHTAENCLLCESRQEVMEDFWENRASLSDKSAASMSSLDRDVEADFLVQRLAKANAQRRQQFFYWRAHHNKREIHTDMNLKVTGKDMMNPRLAHAMGRAEGNPGTSALQIRDLLNAPTITTATRLIPAVSRSFDTRSEVSVSEYAGSSYDPGSETYEFPPAPKGCKSGTQVYDNRAEWIVHENSVHRKQWRCPDHPYNLTSSQEDFLQHIASNHPDDTDLMATEQYLHACEAVSEYSDRPCPICLFFTEDAITLNNHIARHLERLSIFSLPRSRTNDDGTVEEEDSAAAINADEESRPDDTNASSSTSQDWDNWRLELFAAAKDKDHEKLGSILRDAQQALPEVREERSIEALWQAVLIACQNDDVNFAQSLLNCLIRQGGTTPKLGPMWSRALLVASTQGSIGMVKLLGRYGDVYNETGAFIEAVRHGNLKLVEFLVANGFDVKARALVEETGEQTSALAEAAAVGDMILTRFLLDQSADPDPTDLSRSPLSRAAMNGRLDVVRMLLKSGASPVPGDTDPKDAPLTLASGAGHTAIVEALLDANIPVNPKVELSHALIAASKNGHLTIVELLLKYGADPNCVGDDDITPYGAADQFKHEEVQMVLTQAGAKPNINSRLIRNTNSHKLEVEYLTDAATQLDMTVQLDIGCSSVVTCVGFSRDGQLLVAGFSLGAAVYNTKHGSVISRAYPPGLIVRREGEDSREYVRGADFSLDGKHILLACENKIISVHDVLDGRLVVTLTGHEEYVYSVHVSPDGKFVVSTGFDKTARIWSLNDWTLTKVCQLEDGATMAKFSPDGRSIAVSSLDNDIYVYDASTAGLIAKLTGCKNDVYGVAFAHDGRSIYGASLDHTIKRWELSGEENVWRSHSVFHGFEDYALSVTCMTRSRCVAGTSKDNTVRIWDTDTGEALCTLKGYKNSVIRIATSPTDTLLATASGDHSAAIWRYRSFDDAKDEERLTV
ncbi:general transcription repressor [Exophiala xenobiotica]|nr:general transcription repressor [Exophiala xenobiotica]